MKDGDKCPTCKGYLVYDYDLRESPPPLSCLRCKQVYRKPAFGEFVLPVITKVGTA